MEYLKPMEEALAGAAAGGMAWGQARVAPSGRGWSVTHAGDHAAPLDKLKRVDPSQLRALANSTAAGDFRPLKSAPNLPGGWRCDAADAAALRECLEALYPGSVADWFALRAGGPEVVHFREFVNRQTGMYRITQLLPDTLAAQTIRAACHPRVCLKRRLWTLEGLEPDAAGDKSVIPCLDPCAILLDFARKSAKGDREEKLAASLTPLEGATILAALERALDEPSAGGREADTANPLNPRRVLLVLERLRATLTPPAKSPPAG